MTKGLFRLWIALSIIWIAVIGYHWSSELSDFWDLTFYPDRIQARITPTMERLAYCASPDRPPMAGECISFSKVLDAAEVGLFPMQAAWQAMSGVVSLAVALFLAGFVWRGFRPKEI